ncbi:DNA ligase D [Legionella adelaidensis]|uniref:DNA ligase (ATP) n=1 Tax=Legionella adelaidensis TaxID=45056 RepID=A0A0W0R113_9GAMM|nr:DNA ligase D [Legionella adelaidensis]KTC64741.1 DNA ligase D [Legionella adelaidensis]
MGLEKYYQKRDFTKTKEPRGQVSPENNFLFIIQKHAASHLHYDFRLELNGVLLSWAVPKGPCLDPSVKRLAMHVEDHPIEYGSFEGIIPKGEYGGGTVLLWDKGTWKPLDENPTQAYHKGHLRFLLHAEKLKGRWDLIRYKKEENDNAWFLMKYKDDYAQPLDEYDITKEEPDSVVSGLSLKEIAEEYNAVWTRKEGLKEVTQRREKKKASFEKVSLKLPKAPFPGFIQPQLATLVSNTPEGDEWAHEIKFDGYRMIAYKNGKQITFLSRNNKDWTKEFASIIPELRKIPLDKVILDGEMVFLDEKSRSSFQLLQNYLDNGSGSLIYYVFDLLYYDQWDVRELTLLERKTLLEPLLLNVSPAIRYSDHIIGQGHEMFKHACQFGLEGVISKRIDAPYITKRTKNWLKIKCVKRQEFVIGGFTPPQGARSYFGSLFLGVFNDQGKLQFCGNVGTGFTEKSLEALNKKFKKLVSNKNPFTTNPPGVKKAVWVKPELVAEVEFMEWTSEGRLRHPSFKGLREDKKATDIIVEKEVPLAEIKEELIKPKEGDKPIISISNPHKILYPEDDITKGEICEYYDAISSYILPYIKKRPLTLVRCPGSYKECFFQKHFNKSSSKALNPLPIKSSSNELENYMYLTDKKGLLGLVQMGVLEIHPWGSTVDHLEFPDILIFDLDPAPDLEWFEVVTAAREVRKYLEELDLQSFVKTTGGKGLHVVIPIEPKHDWDVIKNFSELFAEFVQKHNPDKYVTNMSKAKRKGKIFLDYLRNQRNATAVAAYSTRARVHAPVATPLHWDELSKNYDETYFTIKTLCKRLSTLKKDPWEDFFTLKQALKIK